MKKQSLNPIPWYQKAFILAGAVASLFFGEEIIRIKWSEKQAERREELSRLEQQAQFPSEGDRAKGTDYWSSLLYSTNSTNWDYADNLDDQTASDPTNSVILRQKLSLKPSNTKQNSPSASYELSRKTNLPSRSRGVRNKNPGNIKIVPGKRWAGQVGTDGQFAVFRSHEYGLRAIGKNIRDQEDMYGRDTIREIITSWAPKEDRNDTNAYIAHVSRYLGSHPDKELDLKDERTVIGLMAAIAKRDSGATYPRQTLEKAYQMLPSTN